MRTAFELNGKRVAVEVEPRASLADCLRHALRLTGTHLGCEHGVCGASWCSSMASRRARASSSRCRPRGRGSSRSSPAPREVAEGSKVQAASLLDIAGTKAAVVQQRAQVRDYLDIDALIRHGIDLPQVLAAGIVVYGRSFNPLITLKALSYFDDVPSLPTEVRERLRVAVAAVDPARLPVFAPHLWRADESGEIS